MTDYSQPNDQIAKRNLVVLIAIQSIVGAMVPMHFYLGGLAGGLIAPSALWATLPISATIIGSMIAAPILTMIMTHYGRIAAFIGATWLATIGLLLAGYAMIASNFAFLVIGSLLTGFYVSAQGFFRFAATDMATPSFRSRAISFSILGGVISAFIGPYVARNYSEPSFATPYFIMAVVGVIMSGAYLLLRLPHVKPIRSQKKVAIGKTLTNRKVLAAMIITISSYSVMNLMMTSTPLAVEGCGYSREQGTFIVQAHVLAMFLPSFFTGYLIRWFGLKPIVFLGIFILVGSSVVALAGVELANFYIALILLGIGWNFGFVGGTNMLTNAITDPDIAKRMQGVNDTIMWAVVALASLSSGFLMNGIGDGAGEGWKLVNYAMLPVLSFALVAGAWLARDRKAD